MLQVEHAHLAADLRERVDTVELSMEFPGEASERLQLDQRVLEMMAVRIDNRRDDPAADLVEEDEVRVHRRQLPTASRYVTPSELYDAIDHWAFCALSNSPGCRTCY